MQGDCNMYIQGGNSGAVNVLQNERQRLKAVFHYTRTRSRAYKSFAVIGCLG